MNTHLLALQLMAMQGCLGAFDTLYHHEITEALPQRISAQVELSIHAVRALIYSVLFIGLSAWAWHGVWAWVLIFIFVIEIVLTLWDFVIEDQSRLLPATERVTHTVLAINGGAFIMLLLLNSQAWAVQASALVWQPQGGLSVFLALCGVGVGVSGLRDAFASWALWRFKHKNLNRETMPLSFGVIPQRVLVTGATGFVGQLLVRALLADGHQVTALTRPPKRAAFLFDGAVRCVADLQDLAKNQPIDVVINLAGARILGWRWGRKRQAVLRASRIGVTEQLAKWVAAADYKPRLLLSASAIGYYGVQKAGDAQKLEENAPSQAIFMSQLCQDWELAAEKVGAQQVVRMRFGLILGQQGSLPMMLLPIKCGFGGRLGRGTQWLSWIHVQDVLRAMAFLCQESQTQNISGAYNFTAPDSVNQLQFSQVAATVLHRPCMMPTPAFPVRLLLGEQADILLEGQRVVPMRLQQQGFAFAFPTLPSALQDLLII